jgi:hypothetical protein
LPAGDLKKNKPGEADLFVFKEFKRAKA